VIQECLEGDNKEGCSHLENGDTWEACEHGKMHEEYIPYRYAWVTHDMFQEKLEAIIDRQRPPNVLLAIEGVYECLSEHFNNQVLEELEKERQ
jgi:hypothetical protein